MTQLVARRVLFILFVLLALIPPLGPHAARAQGAGPTPDDPAPAREGGPAGEDAAPAEEEGDAVVLSLREVLNAALEHNLDVAVRRYDPLRSATSVETSEAAFDPLITGTAVSSDREGQNLNPNFGIPVGFQFKQHRYGVGFEDPLVTGGNYRIDFTANDDLVGVETLDPSTGQTLLRSSSEVDASWTLTFTQPLLRNLGPSINKWQIIVARNDRDISESQFRQTLIDVLSEAEKAYWDLNFALMELETQRSALRLAQEFLEQNRIKVRVGTLAPIEITQAEADVADREERVIVAEHQVLSAEDNLRRIMNIPRDSPWWSRPIRPSDAPPLREEEVDVEAAVAEAERHRPDLKQAELALKSRETELRYRKNQRRWALDFEGAIGYTGVDFDEFLRDAMGNVVPDPITGAPIVARRGKYGDSFDVLRDGDLPNWSLSLNLSVPIGNRESIARYIDAEHALNQARFDLRRLEQLARVEVRNAVRDVRTNIKRVHATQASTRLQREKLEAEQKKFENGMSTSFQVLTFQNDLAEAETRQNLAIVDLNKSLVELERVKGTLIEARDMLIQGTAAPAGPAFGGPGIASAAGASPPGGDPAGGRRSARGRAAAGGR